MLSKGKIYTRHPTKNLTRLYLLEICMHCKLKKMFTIPRNNEKKLLFFIFILSLVPVSYVYKIFPYSLTSKTMKFSFFYNQNSPSYNTLNLMKFNVP